MSMRQLGKAGPRVSAISLGCMGMSGMYGPSDEHENIATIHAALDAGITLFDTGDFYGMGHNEMLLSCALGEHRDRVLLSVKFGALRSPDGAFLGIDNRPQAVRNFAAYSLQRLRTDHIDIYRPARLDPAVPIEDTVGAIADLIRAGSVRYLGLSEAGVETIRRAHAVHPVADVQLEYSLISRGIESRILPVMRELGIGVTAYGVLSRGLLSGSRAETAQDFRAHLPRFTGENLERNQQLVDEFRGFASGKGLTPAQLAVAWVLSRGDDIVALIGARTRVQLGESLAAASIRLAGTELAALENIVSEARVAGTRYDERQMRMLDSEH